VRKQDRFESDKLKKNLLKKSRETLLINSLFDMKVKLKNLLRKLY